MRGTQSQESSLYVRRNRERENKKSVSENEVRANVGLLWFIAFGGG